MAVIKHVDFEVENWGELAQGPELQRGYISEVLADEPVGYWRLNETGGTVALNSGALGSVLNGTYTGSYELGQPGLLARLADKAPRLGVSGWGYVTVAHHAALSGVPFTFELWCRPEYEGIGPIVAKTSSTLSNGWWIWRASEYVRLQFGGGALNLYWYMNAGSGKLIHVGFSYDGETARFYVNGQQVLAQSAVLTANTQPLTLGYRRLADTWLGPIVLAHAAYYGAVLSEQRMRAHYRAGIGR